MKYVCFLRGINVGGNNKVSMAILKEQLAQIGFTNIQTYINSGNVLFESEESSTRVTEKLERLFETNYDFSILFTLLTEEMFVKDLVPDWWEDEMARRNVLFLTQELEMDQIRQTISSFPLQDEEIFFGKYAIFWGKYHESSYLKTSYHKLLIKQPFYKKLTIRNGNTYQKMRELMEERKNE